jgi:hypothetical protein
MIDWGRATRDVRSGIADPDDKDLPYRIELWDAHSRKVERVLARAARAMLARAIFKAAQQEYPDRHIALRRGARVIAEAP